MIRVGFFLPHFRPGGAERVVLNWITALDRTRFTPLLFLKHVDGAFLDLLPNDVQPIALGATRALRLPKHIATAFADHRIDVAYSATNAMNLALLAARAPHTARIVSEHTPPAAYLAEARWPLLRRAAIRLHYPRADAIAVPTDRIGAELARVIARPIHTVTLPNPVVDDVADIAPRTANAIPQLAAAGRLVAAKGHDTLIDACALLAGQGTRFHLTLYGEGPLRAALQARIAAAALGDHVTFAGHTDRLSAAIAAADLFVLSSRREGFGNVLIEAMAVGTPVLATASGGPETLVQPGINGFLVAPENPAALAQTIASLLADAPARNAVRPAAADTARAYAIAPSTRRFEALLASLAPPRSMAA